MFVYYLVWYLCSKRSGMLGQREYVALGISMILCSTTDLVPTSMCLPFGASGFKFGSWVDVVTSADDKILCQIVVCLWGKARMGSAYDFNLLMYFVALRIGTRCLPVISFVGLPTILPKMKVVAIVYFSDLGWQTNFSKSLQSWRLGGDLWVLKLVTRLIRKKCV